MQKPSLRHQVLEVVVAESIRGLDVEWGKVVVTTRGGAIGLPEGGEAGVDVGIIVDVSTEGGATGLADGVAARERGHVTGGEALGCEHGDEGGEAGKRRWQVVVGSALAGRGGVSPS